MKKVQISKTAKHETARRCFCKSAAAALSVAASLMMFSLVAFAAGDNPAPGGVETTTMSSLSTIIWWIVRVAILGIGGIPAIIKIVQGQADENPRDRNAGIATLIVSAAVFGASFAIQGIIGL